MKTNFSLYSTKGIDTIGTNVVFVTKENAQKDAAKHPLFIEVETRLANYSPLVLKAANTGLGENEQAAMTEVQKHHKRLRKMLQAHAEFPHTEKGIAATALLALFKRAGKLYELKKGDVSSAVQNMLAEFAKPDMVAHIAVAGVTDEVAELKAAKAQYDAIAEKRLDVKSELRQTNSATLERKNLEKALRNYLAFVTAMRAVDGWEDLYSDLNEVMKAARRSVRQDSEPAPVNDETE